MTRVVNSRTAGLMLALSGTILMALPTKIALWTIPQGSRFTNALLLLWWATLVVGLVAIGSKTKSRATYKYAILWSLFMMSFRPSVTDSPYLIHALRVSDTAGTLSSIQLFWAQYIAVLALAMIVY